MHHFFVDPSSIEEGIVRIVGTDLNHMKNVLRMKPGEEVLISDGTGKDYNCQVKEYGAEEGILVILSENADSRELPSRIWLFQGLPKSDKMEVILQKAVELGAAGVIPVATRNAVVKLDAKKAEAKIRRWQAIAESGVLTAGWRFTERGFALAETAVKFPEPHIHHLNPDAPLGGSGFMSCRHGNAGKLSVIVRKKPARQSRQTQARNPENCFPKQRPGFPGEQKHV